jgi:hypothetical protein
MEKVVSLVSKEKFQIRKIQSNHNDSTYFLHLPKHFVERLKIVKGDYVRCDVVDNALVVKKAEV